MGALIFLLAKSYLKHKTLYVYVSKANFDLYFLKQTFGMLLLTKYVYIFLKLSILFDAGMVYIKKEPYYITSFI